jgi:hypothetical protein
LAHTAVDETKRWGPVAVANAIPGGTFLARAAGINIYRQAKSDYAHDPVGTFIEDGTSALASANNAGRPLSPPNKPAGNSGRDSGARSEPGDANAKIAAHPGEKVSLTTQFWILYGRTLPISVVFGILGCGAGILCQACAHYLVLRRANGQPTSLVEALQLTKPRILPFLGQSILAALILVVGALTPPILGTFFLPDGTKIIGNIVAIAVILCLNTIFWATFGGVVLIERAGIARCFRLVRPRFWATLGRMLLVALIYGAFAWLLVMVIWVASEPTDGNLSALGAVVAFTINLVLCVPLMVLQVAISIVSYAELRFHEEPTTTTRTLLAEMTRPR